MTRINVGIKPKELSAHHLMAEHKEIVRIATLVKSGKAKLGTLEKPHIFRLGPGHVKFFYDKMMYLYKRYLDLYAECRLRGYNVECYATTFTIAMQYRPELFNDWKPEPWARIIIQERILSKSKVFHHWDDYARVNIRARNLKIKSRLNP